jgi:hypothetical protein
VHVPELRFNIGNAFPPDDPVARFVTVLAMMSNDWLRIIHELVSLTGDDEEAGARRIMLFRQQAALHHEAAAWLKDAPQRFEAIADFMAGLDHHARADIEVVVGGQEASSEFYIGDWHEKHCHVTFHYPIVHSDRAAAGAKELYNALRAAAHIDSTISWQEDEFGSVRFCFADEVTVQWLPDAKSQSETHRAASRLGRGARSIRTTCRAGIPGLPTSRRCDRRLRMIVF